MPEPKKPAVVVDSNDKIPPVVDALTAGVLARIDKVRAENGDKAKIPTDTTTSSSSTSVTKLTPASARGMMEEASKAAGYTGTFTDADVKAFMKAFAKKQADQIERINTIARSKMTPDTTKEGFTKIVQSTAREEFPSFFKPVEFASDFIWARVNFGDKASLSGKNLGILSGVRGVVKDFQILGYSDSEALIAAKDIARGKYTLADFTTTIQAKAVTEYPQFADRFKVDPTLTTKKIAQPIIDMLAATWEVDADTIDMNNPIVTSWLHPGGADGKKPAISYNEAYQRALNDPKRESTKAANDSARDAAVGLASAFGFGV